MKYGFTGTQKGSTPAQRDAFAAFISKTCGSLTHGDCVGWDAEAHDLAEAAGLLIWICPPSNPRKQAHKTTAPERLNPPLPYLVRNKIIVKSTEMLLAAPGERQEQLRSGTWSTMRFARKLRKPIVAFYPSGEVKEYHFSCPDV